MQRIYNHSINTPYYFTICAFIFATLWLATVMILVNIHNTGYELRRCLGQEEPVTKLKSLESDVKSSTYLQLLYWKHIKEPVDVYKLIF